jgi:Alkylmercury lyase
LRMGENELAERLHYLLTRQIVATGHAPDAAALALLAGLPQAQSAAGLRKLAEIHGVILEPDSLRVWSLHPFSMIPTSFWVGAGECGWWANCAWCALGIGAAIGRDVKISARDGAEGDALEFEVKSRRASREEVLLHLPYPPERWWDNPYCPCGNILFFTSEAAIEDWCRRHGRPKGAILPVASGIALAEKWFGDYASPKWRRKSAELAMTIFAELGLDPSFWNLPGSFR